MVIITEQLSSQDRNIYSNNKNWMVLGYFLAYLCYLVPS